MSEKHECQVCGSEVSVIHKTKCNNMMIWPDNEIELCNLCYTTNVGSRLMYRPHSPEDYVQRELFKAMLQIGNNIRELVLAQTKGAGCA